MLHSSDATSSPNGNTTSATNPARVPANWITYPMYGIVRTTTPTRFAPGTSPGSGPSFASPFVSNATPSAVETTPITRCVTGTSLDPRTNVITSFSATVLGSRSATTTTSPGAISGVILGVSTTKLSSAPTTSGAAYTAKGATRAINTAMPSTFAARFVRGEVSIGVISSPPSRRAVLRPSSFRRRSRTHRSRRTASRPRAAPNSSCGS